MSKNTANSKTKSFKKRISKEPKLDAIKYVLTLKLNTTEQMVLIRLIIKAQWYPKHRLEAAKLTEINFADPGYYTRYTQAKLAKEMGISRPTVCKIISKLVSEGLISNHGGSSIGKTAYCGTAFIPVDVYRDRLIGATKNTHP